MADPDLVNGLSLKQWAGSFRPGMPEFAATNFTFTQEGKDLVRIAFCNQGPFVSEGERVPVFTHAVTLPPDVAVSLAGLLLKLYAQPAAASATTSGEI